MQHRIFPISESAVTIDFGNVVSLELNEKVILLAEYIRNNAFVGFIEAVPAYSSLTVYFDLLRTKCAYAELTSVFPFVRSFLENALALISKKKRELGRVFELPVDYGEKYAFDLDYVAECANLTKDEVIKIHSEKVYRVFMIGFLPGFAYMGELDPRIATPRKDTPRTKVEKGSIGIAGSQTGIYPLESPGGWQIIGKTEIEIFTPDSDEPSLLSAGDFVKFKPI